MNKINFLGLSISQFYEKELNKYILDTVQSGKKRIFYGYGLMFFYLMFKHPQIYDYSEKNDLFVVDGRIFYFLIRLHGYQIPYEISIPQLVFLTLELANKFRWNVFLLGATEEDNKKAKENIQQTYPGIGVVEGKNGFFNKCDKCEIIKNINENKPNIVLIGISSPIKEEIAIKWKEELNTNIIIPCGGMIDVLSGKTNITPRWAKKLGLASVYRLIQEPKRLFKSRMAFFGFFLFRFIPVYFCHVLVKKDNKFSFQNYLNKKNHKK